MGEESVQAVRGVYDAFAQGDVPAVLGAMADDIEWYQAEGMPYGGLHKGPEAVAQNVFGPITTDVEGFTVTPEEYFASGDTVAVVVRYAGTGKSTGKQLNTPVVHVWTCATARSRASASSWIRRSSSRSCRSMSQ